jgi:predicted nucleic acid-binding Zn ribbon protein
VTAERRPDGPRAISSSLESVLRRFRRGDLVGVAALDQRWVELLGDEVAGHSRPVALRHASLVVLVDQPAWATQVRLRAGARLAELAAAAGQPIEQIEVRVGR